MTEQVPPRGHEDVDQMARNFLEMIFATCPEAYVFILLVVPSKENKDVMDTMASGNLEPEDVVHYLDQMPPVEPKDRRVIKGSLN